jgi:hypothetical protein
MLNSSTHPEVLSTVAENSGLSSEDTQNLIRAWGEEKASAILNLNSDKVKDTILKIVEAAEKEWSTFYKSESFSNEVSPASIPLFSSLIKLDKRIREQNKVAVILPSFSKETHNQIASIYQEINTIDPFENRFEALEGKNGEFRKEMEIIFNLLLMKLPVEMMYMYEGFKLTNTAKPATVEHWKKYFPMYFNILEDLGLN